MTRHRKAIASVFMLICLTVCTVAGIVPTGAASIDSIPFDKANAVYIYNIENDAVLSGKNTDTLISPGSTVKIMSALLICESLGDRLDEKITVTADMVKNIEGRYAGLKAGDTPTVRDLIYMAFCGCYNDAIRILETIICSGDEAFVKKMNSRAGELLMYNTVYTNATGVDNAQMHTTVTDLSKLALAASKNELLMTVTSTVSYTTEGLSKDFDFYNYNRLHISGSYKNTLCRGLNAGNTPGAGYTLCTIAEKEGLSYLCIVMGAVDDDYNNVYSYVIANKLINWAIDTYGYVDVIKSTDIITEIPVKLSIDVTSVLVVPEKTVTLFLPLSTAIGKDITWTYTLTFTEIEAPVVENAQVGQLTVFMGDQPLETVFLVTKTSVSKSELLTWMEKVKNFSKSTFFKSSLICAAVLGFLYIVLKAVLRTQTANNRRNRHYR